MKTIERKLEEFTNEAGDVQWKRLVGKTVLCADDITQTTHIKKVSELFVDQIIDLTDSHVLIQSKEQWNYVLKNSILAVLENELPDIPKYAPLKDMYKEFLDQLNEKNQSIPPNPRPWEYAKKCTKCGLEIGGVMGYVCPNYPCPTGLGSNFVYCQNHVQSTTENSTCYDLKN
jgi:hypothetical protein